MTQNLTNLQHQQQLIQTENYTLNYNQSLCNNRSFFNKSSVSLPLASSISFNSLSYPSACSRPNDLPTTISKSRSPVVIVYDNDDYESLDTTATHTNQEFSHYGSINLIYDSDSNFESKKLNEDLSLSLSSSSLVQNKSQISYV